MAGLAMFRVFSMLCFGLVLADNSTNTSAETAPSEGRAALRPGSQLSASFPYAYFITSPGQVQGSYIMEPAATVTGGFVEKCYFKFGDATSTQNHDTVGIRNSYLTHNPDIGVWGVFHNWVPKQVFADADLGDISGLGKALEKAILKKYFNKMLNGKYQPKFGYHDKIGKVDGREWFWTRKDKCDSLTRSIFFFSDFPRVAMKKVEPANFDTLKNRTLNALRNL